MACIHVYNVKEDLILVFLANCERDEALLRHFHLSHTYDRFDRVRSWVYLGWQTQLVYRHLGDKILTTTID